MPPQKRRPQPGGDCGASEKVLASGFDFLRDTPQNRKKQARARSLTRFARSMVFEVFPYRDARAIDYDRFVDRKPNQRPRTWGARP